MTRISHVITTLDAGGAEVMLARLLESIELEGSPSQVVSLTDVGPVGERIRELGVDVRSLGLDPGRPNPLKVPRLVSILRDHDPDVVQTWMYHADLLGGLAAQLLPGTPVVWGLHHTDHDEETTSRTTEWTVEACTRLASHVPERIVCCSHATLDHHASLGYPASKMQVIPNGFDPEAFSPDHASEAFAEELGLPADAFLVGRPGRPNPQKDYSTLVEAAARVVDRAPEVHVLLWGPGIDEGNEALVELIRSAGIEANVHLLGYLDDVAGTYASLDLVVSSSSHGEAFPLIIGEAMLSGVPVVSTDVGDAARIVGDTGEIVPPRDPAALAEAILEMRKRTPERRAELGRQARERIEDRFSLDAVAQAYERLYQELSADSDAQP